MTTPDTWQKSSFSGGGEGNACVELASTPTPTTIHLRESDTPTTQLTTTPTPWPISSAPYVLEPWPRLLRNRTGLLRQDTTREKREHTGRECPPGARTSEA